MGQSRTQVDIIHIFLRTLMTIRLLSTPFQVIVAEYIGGLVHVTSILARKGTCAAPQVLQGALHS